MASGAFGKFTGNTIGEAAAFAAGIAIAPLLEPVVQELRNQTWAQAPDRPLDAEVAAEAVAEGFLSEAQGKSEAALTGIASTPFETLVELSREAPAVAEARNLIRRNAITLDQLHHAYAKAKIEPQFWPALDVLIQAPIPPAVAALAAVRGLIPDEGTLPVAPPTEQGKVPAFPVYNISGKAAAAAAGFSEEVYSVMVGINGRPMSLHEAASAYFRGIIELADYYRAVSEGDTRNEWREAILEQAREIITAHDAVENTIRGYSDQATMFERTARHGMSTDDTTILFQNAGRPLSVHQITTGLARGGSFHPEPGELTDPYEASVHESNIKPAYYELAIANKYTLPGYFVIKAMLAAGTITEAEGEQLFREEGWPPDLAAKAASALAGSAKTAPADSHVKSSETAAITAIRKAYVGGARNRGEATSALTQLGVSAETQDGLFKSWDVQKAIEAAAAP
jgi:hypothetical protein